MNIMQNADWSLSAYTRHVGLAIVDIGGLSAGVIVALFMVPVYYALLSRKPKEEIPDID